MESNCNDRCETCIGSPFICHCMKVTQEALVEVIVALEIRTLHDLRRRTGAGDGCMACRERLQTVLDQCEKETLSGRLASVSLAVIA